MLQWANTSVSTGGSVTIGPGPAVVNGASGYVGLFCPTAQQLTDGTGAIGTLAERAVRNSQTCFMRGFAENIRVQTSSALPWFWRRITFRTKSPAFHNFNPGDTPTQTNSGRTDFVDTSNGIERLWFNQFVNNGGGTVGLWYEIIFKGVQNKDWTDPLTAPLDTARIDVSSDRLMTLKSGNQSGTVRSMKLWYPMNKNLVYSDDESGSTEASSYFSVVDKQGMGDYMIMDIVVGGTGASASDLLQFTSTSSLYWHEK